MLKSGLANMLFFKKRKDSGLESAVTGYWFIESKKFFSILLLKFEGKSREAFHTHAFNCFSIVLKGKITETMLSGSVRTYSIWDGVFLLIGIHFIKLIQMVLLLFLNFRGPWTDKWKEFLPGMNKYLTLTHGRKVVSD